MGGGDLEARVEALEGRVATWEWLAARLASAIGAVAQKINQLLARG